ncbi:MAG: tripartite tricarboxylate transporter substrate binding protein [Burkholderiales bacterium]|nr:tripartite tricarboxylate transporter substrate binding protein [Burkholderiales bacterium]
MLALLALAGSALAQPAAKFPQRPLRMIVPAPPGGTTDLLGRLVAERLAESLGQQVVVDNRGGAGGILGTELLARAPADGHTLGIIYTPHTVLPHLQKKLPYDPLRDFAAVSLLTEAPLVLVVHPALPVHKLQDLIALAKTRPLVYGSAGNGSGGHLSGELLKQMAKFDATHVPYKGAGPAAADLVAGQLQFQFASQITARNFVGAGRLRAIAVSSAQRSAALPNLPTVAEQGLPGFAFVNWFGTVVPARTPPVIVNALQQQIAQILQQPAVSERLKTLDSTVVGSTPAVFSAFLAADMAKWGTVLRNSGVKVD